MVPSMGSQRVGHNLESEQQQWCKEKVGRVELTLIKKLTLHLCIPQIVWCVHIKWWSLESFPVAQMIKKLPAVQETWI